MKKSSPLKGATLSREYPTPCSCVSCLSPGKAASYVVLLSRINNIDWIWWNSIYDAVSGHVESLSWSVIKNLTLHRVRKIIFSFYHHKVEIRSFPTMYNTWGCLLVEMGENNDFLQKSGLKTPILAATVLDHPTSKWAGTHNFKDIANFHRCFKKSGT